MNERERIIESMSDSELVMYRQMGGSIPNLMLWRLEAALRGVAVSPSLFGREAEIAWSMRVHGDEESLQPALPAEITEAA